MSIAKPKWLFALGLFWVGVVIEPTRSFAALEEIGGEDSTHENPETAINFSSNPLAEFGASLADRDRYYAAAHQQHDSNQGRGEDNFDYMQIIPAFTFTNSTEISVVSEGIPIYDPSEDLAIINQTDNLAVTEYGITRTYAGERGVSAALLALTAEMAKDLIDINVNLTCLKGVDCLRGGHKNLPDDADELAELGAVNSSDNVYLIYPVPTSVFSLAKAQVVLPPSTTLQEMRFDLDILQSLAENIEMMNYDIHAPDADNFDVPRPDPEIHDLPMDTYLPPTDVFGSGEPVAILPTSQGVAPLAISPALSWVPQDPPFSSDIGIGIASTLPTVSGAVPEPSTWIMLFVGFGSIGLAGYGCARKQEIG